MLYIQAFHNLLVQDINLENFISMFRNIDNIRIPFEANYKHI